MPFKSSHKLKYSTAFTLIELLVVVAIIAVLISILLPSLSLAKRQGKSVVCSSGLREQGKAAAYYAQDNRDFNIGGIESVTKGEYTVYSMSILKYLGYDGAIRGLWKPNAQPELTTIMKKFSLFRCPEFPETDYVLHYVSRAITVQYTQDAINFDVSGGGEAGDRYRGEGVDDRHYVGAFQISKLPTVVSPGRFVYVTEAHRSLPAKTNIRYNTFFFTSQLPFGRFPRIANDKRHPGGLSALFYDGHVEIRPLGTLDAGWPNSLGKRLRFFTTVDNQYN